MHRQTPAFRLVCEKVSKDFLRSKFSTWYAYGVQREIENGKNLSEVKIDMSMAVIKEVSAKWLAGLLTTSVVIQK